jgi:hypothetical protein
VAVGVEDVELIGGFQQRLTLALPVKIDEEIADLLEGGDCDWLVVDVSLTAAGAREAPRQDDLVLLKGGLQDLLDGGPDGGRIKFEATGDA